MMKMLFDRVWIEMTFIMIGGDDDLSEEKAEQEQNGKIGASIGFNSFHYQATLALFPYCHSQLTHFMYMLLFKPRQCD